MRGAAAGSGPAVTILRLCGQVFCLNMLQRNIIRNQSGGSIHCMGCSARWHQNDTAVSARRCKSRLVYFFSIIETTRVPVHGVMALVQDRHRDVSHPSLYTLKWNYLRNICLCFLAHNEGVTLRWHKLQLICLIWPSGSGDC